MQTNNPHRLLSLDVFRGLTIALMILVNSPGNASSYDFLTHSPWNGCTLADVVFPFFLFIVGVSLVFSFTAKKYPPATSILIIKAGKRAIVLFFIGLFLNAFPWHFDFETLRVYGVLQRIAICYFVASVLFLTTTLRTQAILFFSILIAYWIILIGIPFPGHKLGQLTLEDNLAGYVDRLIFSSPHLYQKIGDPEGLLSTLPAIATTLLGVFTGVFLQKSLAPRTKYKILIITSIVMMLAGGLWGYFFPINKALWSSSYVLWTGALAIFVLALCYALIEIKHYRKWSFPLEVFGVNAIAAYFLHIFFLKVQAMVHFTSPDGTTQNLRIMLTNHLFYWASPSNAALFYAISYLLLWGIVLTLLYRKKLFIKI